MTQLFDLCARPINEGDWVIQAYNVGQCGAIKVAYVTGFTDTNRIRLVSFSNNYRYTPGCVDQPEFMRSKNYAVKYPSNVCVIPKEHLPANLLSFVEDTCGGDPLCELEAV